MAFIKKITKPKLLSTLKPIPFNVINNDSEYIVETYPFFTISDLKLAIYELFDREDYAAPNNQLIYIDKKVGIDPIDFSWEAPMLKNPQLDIINNYFVNPDGSKKNIKINLNDNILLENKLKNNTINLIFYKDVEKYLSNIKPFSEKIFNGRIYPYFPFLKNNITYPNEGDLQILSLKLEYYNSKLKYINTIENLLTSSETLVEPVFFGLRFLKLTWPYNKLKDNIDSYFYEIDVNPTRPYLRLLSSGNSAISKVHLKDIDNKIPSIYDINLLSQWSEEKNPIPGHDFIIGKIALRCTILNIPFIYSTIRLLEDGSFDVIIEPPKNIRKLNIGSDFGDTFEEDIINGLDKINLQKVNPSLSSGNLIFENPVMDMIPVESINEYKIENAETHFFVPKYLPLL
jgi:hypothetical protein